MGRYVLTVIMVLCAKVLLAQGTDSIMVIGSINADSSTIRTNSFHVGSLQSILLSGNTIEIRLISVSQSLEYSIYTLTYNNRVWNAGYVSHDTSLLFNDNPAKGSDVLKPALPLDSL